MSINGKSATSLSIKLLYRVPLKSMVAAINSSDCSLLKDSALNTHPQGYLIHQFKLTETIILIEIREIGILSNLTKPPGTLLCGMNQVFERSKERLLCISSATRVFTHRKCIYRPGEMFTI